MKIALATAALWLAASCSAPQETAAAQQAPLEARTASANALIRAALPTTGAGADVDPLVEAIGTATHVALGEATHGTHEFYRERARLSERLIREHGFGAVLIEADAPETERVNRYVRGIGIDASAEQALSGYTRFPRWMWRNAEFRDFVERLRAHNATLPPAQRAGVYGMDVYNLFGAADAVVSYLAGVDPAAAHRARTHYRCFAPYRPDEHRYGTAARRPKRTCRGAAEAVLTDVRRVPRPADPVAIEARFAAIRNAFAVVGAEEYFRTLYAGSMSWNARDRRMAATVEEVAAHVSALSDRPGRVVAWAHNSHVGDARATDAVLRGELNLGQLLRERHGISAFLVGFLTHGGTVVAADQWDAPGRVRTLRPALPESYSGLLHSVGIGEGLLLLRRGEPAAKLLSQPRLERAVGVIYAPATERQSHYFRADLPRQFDAVIYFDRTTALTPLR
jgi:erythromycin esterase-like protein